MRGCLLVPPPSEEQLYSALERYPDITDPWEARTLLIVDYSDALLTSLGDCNKQMEKLRTWRSKTIDQGATDDDRRDSD